MDDQKSTPTGQQALSGAAAPQAVALTDEQIEAEWFKAAGHGIASGRLLDDAKRFAHAILDATPAQAQKEPDCWAILTPNGSRLVSPEEAKGRRDAYPLYREAPQSSPAPATADARDAARYRWLSRQAVATHTYKDHSNRWEVDYVLRGTSFGAAIDAAMSRGDKS